jgi:hypothetical protein
MVYLLLEQLVVFWCFNFLHRGEVSARVATLSNCTYSETDMLLGPSPPNHFPPYPLSLPQTYVHCNGLKKWSCSSVISREQIELLYRWALRRNQPFPVRVVKIEPRRTNHGDYAHARSHPNFCSKCFISELSRLRLRHWKTELRCQTCVSLCFVFMITGYRGSPQYFEADAMKKLL